MKYLKWLFVGWTTWQYRYAARFVCPEWGHKPMSLGDYHGRFDKIAGDAGKDRCANCNQLYETT